MDHLVGAWTAEEADEFDAALADFETNEMNPRFQKVVSRMEPLLEELRSSDLLTCDDLKRVPQQGVYVFYEGGTPIYVGRSRRMRQRIREHGARSSRHESATFALKLLRHEVGEPEGHASEYTRPQLQERYPVEYAARRERVRNMRFRVVEIENPVVQTVFETYAILALDTKEYNTFHTT